MKKKLMVVSYIILSLAFIPKQALAGMNINPCVGTMSGLSKANALEKFESMFNEYGGGPVNQNIRPYEEDLLRADHQNIFIQIRRDAEQAITRIHSFVGPNAQRALLIENPDGSHEIVIGTINITGKTVSKNFLVETRNHVSIPGNSIFGNLFKPENRVGALSYQYISFDAKVPVSYEITQTNGDVKVVPYERVVAMAGDLRNREKLFTRSFPQPGENGIDRGSYLMNLIYSQNWGSEGGPAVQNSLNKIKEELEGYYLKGESLALLIREPDRNQVFVTGLVRPITEKVRGYNGIVGLEIKTDDGKTLRVPIADHPAAWGVMTMTNKPFQTFTPLTAQELHALFNTVQIHGFM